MRWPRTRRRAGCDRWADLTQPDRPQAMEPISSNTERIADMQAEAALLAALNEPTVILENGVRIPAYLARVCEDDA